MRRLLLATCLALAPLAGCATVPAAPVDVANLTIADERAAQAAELAYKAARIAVEFMVDTNQCTGTCATRFRALNRQAYDALQAVRTAYRAGNAADFGGAFAEATSLTNQILTLTGRNQ